jgi:hypothetical protein
MVDGVSPDGGGTRRDGDRTQYPILVSFSLLPQGGMGDCPQFFEFSLLGVTQ